MSAKTRVRSRTKLLSIFLAIAAIGFAAGCSSGNKSPDATATGASLDTLTPGVITVAIRGDLPYAAEEGGKLTGIDGDILRAAADRLGQKLKIQTMDFSGQLGAVGSGQVDVAIGSIGWKPERAKAGIFTDPTYYAAATVIEPSGAHLNTLAALQGRTIGTVTGYAWATAIQAIPGAKLRTYDTADAVYSDVGTKRIDAAFVDALQDIYASTKRTDLGITTEPLQTTPAELATNPAYGTFGKVQLAFYLPKARTKLEVALTTEIRKMYQSGEIAKILEQWGAKNPTDFLTPGTDTKARTGVDRPAGWVPPSAS